MKDDNTSPRLKLNKNNSNKTKKPTTDGKLKLRVEKNITIDNNNLQKIDENVLKSFMDRFENKDNSDPLMWSNSIDAYLKQHLPEQSYKSFKKRWQQQQYNANNQEMGQGLRNGVERLSKVPGFSQGARLLDISGKLKRYDGNTSGYEQKNNE